MRRALSTSIVLCCLVGCGGGDAGNPAGATTGGAAATSSVSVTFPAGGTIFIGASAQLEARETLSDGTTRVAANATWGSDAPNVATVSQTGLVTAIAAGEATIFADVNPRGTLRLRVFPSFGGSWTGREVLTSCEAAGLFQSICSGLLAAGQVFDHQSSFVQSEASVEAEIGAQDDSSARMTGTISVAGELQLPGAPVLPADPEVDVQIQEWRSRADTPSRMTGSYQVFFTASGIPGSATVTIELQDVVKSSGGFTQLSRTRHTTLVESARLIAAALRP